MGCGQSKQVPNASRRQADREKEAALKCSETADLIFGVCLDAVVRSSATEDPQKYEFFLQQRNLWLSEKPDRQQLQSLSPDTQVLPSPPPRRNLTVQQTLWIAELLARQRLAYTQQVQQVPDNLHKDQIQQMLHMIGKLLLASMFVILVGPSDEEPADTAAATAQRDEPQTHRVATLQPIPGREQMRARSSTKPSPDENSSALPSSAVGQYDRQLMVQHAQVIMRDMLQQMGETIQDNPGDTNPQTQLDQLTAAHQRADKILQAYKCAVIRSPGDGPSTATSKPNKDPKLFVKIAQQMELMHRNAVADFQTHKNHALPHVFAAMEKTAKAKARLVSGRAASLSFIDASAEDMTPSQIEHLKSEIEAEFTTVMDQVESQEREIRTFLDQLDGNTSEQVGVSPAVDTSGGGIVKLVSPEFGPNAEKRRMDEWLNQMGLAFSKFEKWWLKNKSESGKTTTEQELLFASVLYDKAEGKCVDAWKPTKIPLDNMGESGQEGLLVSWQGISVEWFLQEFCKTKYVQKLIEYDCPLWFVRKVCIIEMLRRKNINTGAFIFHLDAFGAGSGVTSKATAFLSYTGRCSIRTFVSVLKQLETGYVWMDIFCVDQFAWTGGLEESKATLRTQLTEGLEAKIRDIKRTVLMVERWNQVLLTLDQIWVLWEIYCTARSGASFSVVFSDQQTKSFSLQFDLGAEHFHLIGKQLSAIDCSKSKATDDKDRKKILDRMEEQSLKRVDAMVAEKVMSWYVETAEGLLAEKFEIGETPTPRQYQNIAELYCSRGSYSVAIEYLQSMLDSIESYQVVGDINEHGPHVCGVYYDMANLFAMEREYAKSEECLVKAINGFENLVGTEYGADMYNQSLLGLAYVYQQRGKHQKAESVLRACGYGPEASMFSIEKWTGFRAVLDTKPTEVTMEKSILLLLETSHAVHGTYLQGVAFENMEAIPGQIDGDDDLQGVTFENMEAIPGQIDGDDDSPVATKTTGDCYENRAGAKAEAKKQRKDSKKKHKRKTSKKSDRSDSGNYQGEEKPSAKGKAASDRIAADEIGAARDPQDTDERQLALATEGVDAIDQRIAKKAKQKKKKRRARSKSSKRNHTSDSMPPVATSTKSDSGDNDKHRQQSPKSLESVGRKNAGQAVECSVDKSITGQEGLLKGHQSEDKQMLVEKSCKRKKKSKKDKKAKDIANHEERSVNRFRQGSKQFPNLEKEDNTSVTENASHSNSWYEV